MKPRLKPLLAALVAANVGLPIASANAAVVALEPRIETRTIIIQGTDAIGADHHQSDADVIIAQADTGRVHKEVQVHVVGDRAVRVAIPPIPPIPPIPSIPSLPDVDVLVSNAMSEAFAGSGAAFSSFSSKAVKNAPYSAEVISEKIQTLPDGNQITRRTSSLAYRDSAGRTRQDIRNDKGEVRTIQINDSVDGARYTLSPSRKSATKIEFDKDFAKRIDEIREKAKAAAKVDGKVVIIERGNPGEEIVVKRVDRPRADGKKEVREETTVNVVRVGGDVSVNSDGQQFSYKFGGDADQLGKAMGELARLGTLGPLGHSFHDTKWASKTTTTELGTRDFDGVRGEGKRSSYTIPAGEVGNKNPIVVTSETWYSPELQVTVYSKLSDPRSGDSIYRLANVKRTEQSPALFMVPDGYTTRSVRSIGAPSAKAGTSTR